MSIFNSFSSIKAQRLWTKHVRNSSLWSDVVFEKDIISPHKIKIWSLLLYAHENTQSNATRVFFFHYSLASSMTNWAQSFRRFVIFMHILGRNKWEYWSLTISKGVQCLNHPLWWFTQFLGKICQLGVYVGLWSPILFGEWFPCQCWIHLPLSKH